MPGKRRLPSWTELSSRREANGSLKLKKAILLISFYTLALSGCSGLSKVDYWNLYHRAGWQLPEKTIESLNIQPGDHVADIGAGGGYFTFLLTDAVGPTGKIYAVDVEQEIIEQLADRIAEETRFNVVVILGEFEDPLLPNGTIDLVFLCNTYHHIENRVDYFSSLKTDLKSDGRVAIIDMKDDLTGILRLFATAPHWTSKQLLLSEMEQAGYHHQSGFDFLPVQNFEVFSVN